MIWCKIPEIWSTTGRIFCHFEPFFALLPPAPPPTPPLTTQRIKILKKWKKPLEISSFYTSAPKIMIICYIIPEMRCVTDVIVIFHFELFFALLPPLTAQKIKISIKWRKYLEISSFNISVPKIMLYCFTIPETWRVRNVIGIFHGGLFFALLHNPPKSSKNQNFKKMNKLPAWGYHHLKIMIIYYTVPEIWCMTDVIVIFHFGLFFALLTPLNGNMLMISPLSWIEPIPSSWKEEKVLVLLK